MRGVRESRQLQERIVQSLQSLGPVHNKSGKATNGMLERLDGEDLKHVQNALASLERKRRIVREIRGKRCFVIALHPGASAPAAPEPEPPVLEPESPEPPPFEYDELARALLTECMEVWHKPMELSDVRGQLHEAREEAGRWRSRYREIDVQLRDEQERHRATKNERDGLRSRLRTSEDNLAAALKTGGRVVDEQVRQKIDRFMREKPTRTG